MVKQTVRCFLLCFGFCASAALQLSNLGLNFSQVTYIGHAGDDRLFVAQQGGLIRIVQDGQILPTPFLDLSALVGAGFEQGLLSFAFHPDYTNNGYVYVFYSNLSNQATVARYEVDDGDPNLADPNSGVIVYALNEGDGHYGGQLGFGPDGYLYMSIGDGGTQHDPECDAQNTANVLGTILRLDANQNVNTPPYYGVPVDNPFDGKNGAPAPEVWSLGFRNPWRFSFDRLTGDFYFSDVGQFTREEVNVEPLGFLGGANYGWKAMEGTFCHDNNSPPTGCGMGTPVCGSLAYTEPAIEYDHSMGDCSITGGYVYRGRQASPLYGHYLSGDWCTGRIRASHQGTSGWETEVLSVNVAQIRSFGEDSAGEVYLTNGTAIFQLVDDEVIFRSNFELTNSLD